MPTINELKKKALNDAGYTGSINDAEYKWLRSICEPYIGTISDLWKRALRQAGYTGSLVDMQKAMLSNLGHTGALPNQWYKYWRDTPLEGLSLVPDGNWTSLSAAILSDQSQSGFRIQTAADDVFGMAQKSFNGFQIGATYRVKASVDIATDNTFVTLRVSTAQINNTGNLVDEARTTSGDWDEEFVATATTLFFGTAISRAAFSADATVSVFIILKDS